MRLKFYEIKYNIRKNGPNFLTAHSDRIFVESVNGNSKEILVNLTKKYVY